MKDIASAAEYTTETLRSLVEQLILKHERVVIETMRELKEENRRLSAELSAVHRKPLSDQQIMGFWRAAAADPRPLTTRELMLDFARTVEAAHGIKEAK